MGREVMNGTWRKNSFRYRHEVWMAWVQQARKVSEEGQQELGPRSIQKLSIIGGVR
jgi:hypothetical protein